MNDLSYVTASVKGEDFLYLYKASNSEIRQALLGGAIRLSDKTLLKVIQESKEDWQQYIKAIDPEKAKELIDNFKNSPDIIDEIVKNKPFDFLMLAIKNYREKFRAESFDEKKKSLLKKYVELKDSVLNKTNALSAEEKAAIEKELVKTEESLFTSISVDAFSYRNKFKDSTSQYLQDFTLLSQGINSLMATKNKPQEFKDFLENIAINNLKMTDNAKQELLKKFDTIAPGFSEEIDKINLDLAQSIDKCSASQIKLKIKALKSVGYDLVDVNIAFNFINNLGLEPKDLALFFDEDSFKSDYKKLTQGRGSEFPHNIYNTIFLKVKVDKADLPKAQYLASVNCANIYPVRACLSQSHVWSIEENSLDVIKSLYAQDNQKQFLDFLGDKCVHTYVMRNLKGPHGGVDIFKTLITSFNSSLELEKYVGKGVLDSNLSILANMFWRTLAGNNDKDNTDFFKEIDLNEYAAKMLSIEYTQQNYNKCLRKNELHNMDMSSILSHFLDASEQKQLFEQFFYVQSTIEQERQEYYELRAKNAKKIYSTIKKIALPENWLESQVVAFLDFAIKDYNNKLSDPFSRFRLEEPTNPQTLAYHFVNSKKGDIFNIISKPEHASLVSSITQMIEELKKPTVFSEMPNVRPKIKIK